MHVSNFQNICEAVRFLDWQVFRYGPPVTDLAQNLFTCTNKAIREKEFENLLRVYHDSVSKIVKLLGSNPDKLFTFDDLQGEFKKFGLYALFFGPMTIQVTLADTSEITNMDEYCEKVATGENRQELITGLNETAQSEYGRRINEILEDMVDKFGYFHKLD